MNSPGGAYREAARPGAGLMRTARGKAAWATAASSVAPRDVPGSLDGQEKGAPLRDSRGRPGWRVDVADSDLGGGSARLVRGRPRKDVIGRLWITSRKTMWISCG
jgi:hypothetical protein